MTRRALPTNLERSWLSPRKRLRRLAGDLNLGPTLVTRLRHIDDLLTCVSRSEAKYLDAGQGESPAVVHRRELSPPARLLAHRANLTPARRRAAIQDQSTVLQELFGRSARIGCARRDPCNETAQQLVGVIADPVRRAIAHEVGVDRGIDEHTIEQVVAPAPNPTAAV